MFSLNDVFKLAVIELKAHNVEIQEFTATLLREINVCNFRVSKQPRKIAQTNQNQTSEALSK